MSSVAPPTVLVVENVPEVRSRLIALLARTEGIAVVGAASSVREAVKSLQTFTPDFAVVSIRLGDDRGMEVVRQVRQRRFRTRVALLTEEEGTDTRPMFARAGADACFDKALELHQLLDWIRRPPERLLAAQLV